MWLLNAVVKSLFWRGYGLEVCRSKFAHELGMCAIFRDEARDLDEWLTFHHAVGVGHFYLYNNSSDDEFRQVLEPWIKKGMVTLVDWSRGQRAAYNDCMRRARLTCRWIACVDIDEFLFSPGKQDLKPLLSSYKDAAAIYVYSRIFGSNGHKERPSGGVIANYTRCASDDALRKFARLVWTSGHPIGSRTTWQPISGKSIVNPRLVELMGVHIPVKLLAGKIVDENNMPLVNGGPDYRDVPRRLLRINHYWSKSIEELRDKVHKKRTWDKTNAQSVPCDYTFTAWLEREALSNDRADTTLLALWTDIASGRSPN